MSSMAAEEAVQDGITQEQLKGGDTIEHSDIIEADHHKQHTEAMAEKPCLHEDPATTAASEELKHATISDKKAPSLEGDEDAITKQQSTEEDRQMGGTEKEATPEAEPSDAQNEAMRERISSPKKKRGRDQEDDTEYSDDSKIDEVTSADGPTVNGGRTTRSEPEKKRHRDTSEDPSKVSKASEQVPEPKEIAIMHSQDSTQTSTAIEEPSKKSPQLASKPTFGSSFGGDKPQTSSSAFAASGFGALAGSSTSPFGTVGASKPSVFGGSSSTMSGFGALSGSKSPTLTSNTTSGFGSLAGDKPSIGFGGGFGGAAASGFGGALGSKSVFGSALGNGFGANTAPKLSSFAAAGKDDVKAPVKPVKAFGAPDSDEEEATDDDDGSDAGEGADEEGEKQSPEDKKKFKVSKVPVDDGEAGEVTLVSMRAKLYAVESKEIGWKERGVGTLKVNVNKSCVELSESGQPLEGSLDFSSLEDDDKVPAARLIMRQENTHRVILNTIIMQATDFTPKPSTTGAQILFTAFEGEEPKPISMLLKLNEANGRLFTQEIEKVQYELKLSAS